MKKVLLLLIMFLSLIVLNNCIPKDDWEITLNVPYFESTTDNSTSFAIALWSNYQGPGIPEDIIDTTMGCMQGIDCMRAVENAVSTYTWAIGWLLEFPDSDAGQNAALSSVRESLYDNCPGILPFFVLDHILVIGASGHDEENTPIADDLKIHTLASSNYWVPAGEVKAWFVPIDNKHLVVTGSSQYRVLGYMRYEEFVNAGGTYSGAPANYKPDIDFSGN